MSYTIAVGGGGGPPGPANAQYVVLALDAGLTAERVLTAGTGITIVDGGANAAVTVSINSAFFAGFANPSAQVALTAINGTAVTAMRSDAAPRLNITISPTGAESWSGTHNWSPSANTTPFTLTKTAALTSASIAVITNTAVTEHYVRVSNAGGVGFGFRAAATDPLASVHAVAENDTANPATATYGGAILYDGYGDAANQTLTQRRSLGTRDNPVAISGVNFTLGGIISLGRISAAAFSSTTSGSLEFFSRGAFTASSQPTAFQIHTTPTGATARIPRLTISEDGNVAIGLNTATAAYGTVTTGAQLEVVRANLAQLGVGSSAGAGQYIFARDVGSLFTLLGGVDGAANIAFEWNDVTTRTTGFRRKLRASAIAFEECTWDGRWSWGYGSNVAAQVAHVLGFSASDSNTPAGVPHLVGILASVTHAAVAEIATKLYGVAGVAVVATTTNLTGTLISGMIGTGVGSSTTSSVAGKVLAGITGKVLGTAALSDTEPTTFDFVAIGTGARTVRGNYDHATCFWGDYLAHNSTTSFPVAGSRPLIGSTMRYVIQGFPCGITAGTLDGQAWGLYGEAPSTGNANNFPAITGAIRIPYPRRTGGTGVRAMQLFFEPWPNTTTIRGGNANGDFYYDDGTNFSKGPWVYIDGWRRIVTTTAAFVAPQTYTETNVTTDRAYDANLTTINELADVLGTLIADLRAAGIVA